MLEKIFTLERPLILFDLETTGVNPRECRIVEIGFQLFTSEGMTKEWRSLVNPGIDIPKDAFDVHGISNAAVVDAPLFSRLASSLAKGFSACDFAGKNIRFDLQTLAAEMERERVIWGYRGARVIDAERLEHLGEPRTLADLYLKHTGKVLDDAHSALADVSASAELIVAQMAKYSQLPRSLAELHELQWPGWIDSEGKFRFREDGVPCVAFGKHRGVPMTLVDRGYWKWIIERSDFNPEVVTLARDAMMGMFPKKEK